MKQRIKHSLTSFRLNVVLFIAVVVVFTSSAAVISQPAGVSAATVINVKSAGFQYRKALVAMKGHYYYNAVQHFQKAILLKPHFASAWAHMGVALHKLGFPSLAIVSLQKALKYDPNIKWAQITLKKYIASPRR